jgi:hypothetical protein
MNTPGPAKRVLGVRKRELSPLQRARLSLGLKVDARPKTNLACLLRKSKLGKTAIDYLGVSNDEQALRIVALYQRLNRTERKAVTIDYLMLAAGAELHHIWGCIQEELSRAAGVTICEALPEMLRKSIERAMGPDGYRDCYLLLQMAGLLPVPGQPGLLERLGL